MFTCAFLVPLIITVFSLFTVFTFIFNPISFSLFFGVEVQSIKDADAFDPFGFEHP